MSPSKLFLFGIAPPKGVLFPTKEVGDGPWTPPHQHGVVQAPPPLAFLLNPERIRFLGSTIQFFFPTRDGENQAGEERRKEESK